MAYTPGLKKKELTIVRKMRKLPISGEVLVREGDKVTPSTIVARASIPGEPHVVNAANSLGVDPGMERPGKYMIKRVGDTIKEGEVIAKLTMFFGLIKKFCYSPCSGSIELISDLTGQVVVREPPIQIEVNAYIPGVIHSVIPKESVVIETPAAFIQGIFGVGGETYGKIKVVGSNDKSLEPSDIGADCYGKILIVKTSPSAEDLRKAVQIGAAGLISGCINVKELLYFIGYEIGVAITGHEDLGLTLIITEGLGEKMNMSDKTFQLLKKFEGELAAINGATQIRAGVMRPEIIIPREGLEMSRLSISDVEDTKAFGAGLTVGTLIRVIRGDYFGTLGRIIGLPPALEELDTESKARVLEAELEDGHRVIIPRANVEIISE